MKALLVSILLIGSAADALGQKLSDLILLYNEEAEFTFGLNNRRTHIYDDFGTIYGVFFGLNFDRKLRNTFLLSSTIVPLGQASEEGVAYSRASFHFVGVTEEYTYFKKNRIKFSAYASLGYGFSKYQLRSYQHELLLEYTRGIVPLELGLHTTYEIIPWLELRAGLGWRFFLRGNQNGLSGYYFKIALGLKYKAFKKALKNKSLL